MLLSLNLVKYSLVLWVKFTPKYQSKNVPQILSKFYLLFFYSVYRYLDLLSHSKGDRNAVELIGECVCLCVHYSFIPPLL